MTCSVCGGELLTLGVLGKRLHMRCRACGIESSVDKPTTDDEEWRRVFVAPFDDEHEGVDAGELSAWEANEERRR